MRKRTSAIAALLAVMITATNVCRAAGTNDNSFGTIRNDSFWHTQDGQPLYSQGGGIFRFKDPDSGAEKYYWYGVRYQGSKDYMADPSVTVENAVFDGVTCYSSTNLTDWKYEGDVLDRSEIAAHERVSWVGRLGVAYIDSLHCYSLIVQCGSGVLFTTSPSPTGPFRWQWKKDMTATIGTPNTGDQTVFTDCDTGRSYLIYSFGRGRSRIYVSEIGVRGDSIDLLDCTKIFHGASREGNCMFKYKGRYYMCASNIYGWDGSYAYYLMADDIRGPYLPANDMQIMPGCEADYAHVSQTGFFYTVRGTKQETVIYCGDRWACFAGNGLGYNQWVPLSFDKDGKPYFNSLSSWSLNETTGEWRVNDDNNYIRNGSFDADRRRIPNPVKPRQEYLLGWDTEIIKGHAVAVGDSLSPKLNHPNTREDRQHVTGEFSLCISDTVDFTRRVSQVVESSPYVNLPDGTYTLTAKVRRKGRFSRLTMFTESGNRKYEHKIKPSAKKWTAITLDGIKVSGGRVTVGFYADGKGGAECLADDVCLTISR